LETKFLVFVVISTLLVATMYSSSVLAKQVTKTTVLKTKYSTTYCTGDSTHAVCTVVDNGDHTTSSFICDKQKNGTWKCVQDQTVGNISAGLKQALISAQGGIKTGSSNTTILQGNGNSEGGNSEGGNSKMPLRLNATTSTNPNAVMGSNSTFQ